MEGFDQASDWESLALDADRVREGLLTLTWFLRGMHSAAESLKVRDLTGRALGVAEVAMARSEAVSAAVSRTRDLMAQREEGDSGKSVKSGD